MLVNYQNDQLQQVADIIVQTVAPEKIYLLGVSSADYPGQNIFIESNAFPGPNQTSTHYFLLMLTRKNDKRPFYELQEFIESRCRLAATVSIFIEGIHVFNEWLLTGHPFARRVHASGLLVYDLCTALATPAPVNINEEQILLQKEYSNWNNKITEFLAGAELYNLRRQFGLSAFLLAQAAEHAYTILIRVVTGYRLATHNLHKLIRFASPFSADLALLFPRNTEYEKHLFQLLHNAYIGGRYKDDFNITEEELGLLHERIKKLQAIIKKVVNLLQVKESAEHME